MRRFILLFVLFFVAGGSILFSQTAHYKIKRSHTFYVPEEVEETSGLFFWNGDLFTFNDSGGKNMLYVLDTMGGEIKKRIPVIGAVNRDWEAATIWDNKLYIGDFGNNSARRKDLTIYLADLNRIDETLPTVDSIRFHYPEQTNFEKQKRNHDFDCEAMVVFRDTVYLYSKGWQDGTTKIRTVPAVPGEYAAQEINRFDAGGLISDAAYDTENKQLVLIGYNIETPIMQPFLWLFKTAHPGRIKASNGIKIMLEPAYSQIEGVSFFPQGRLAITAEGLNNKWIDIAPALFKINLDALKEKADGN
jgi:hypothetical protein